MAAVGRSAYIDGSTLVHFHDSFFQCKHLLSFWSAGAMVFCWQGEFGGFYIVQPKFPTGPGEEGPFRYCEMKTMKKII